MKTIYLFFTLVNSLGPSFCIQPFGLFNFGGLFGGHQCKPTLIGVLDPKFPKPRTLIQTHTLSIALQHVMCYVVFSM
jgi:hypothetical protein